MRKLIFTAGDRICDDCALALRRFIGQAAGVQTVEVGDREVAVVFDPAMAADDDLIRLTTENLERLGHKLIEHLHFIEKAG